MRDGSPRVMIRFNVMGPRVAARMVAARIGSTPRRAALAAATALAGVLLWTPASALASTVTAPQLTPSSGLKAATEITFKTNAESDILCGEVTYSWTFTATGGGASTSSAVEPKKTFPRGSYTASVQISQAPVDVFCPDGSVSNVASTPFTIGNTAPTVSGISGPSVVKPNVAETYTATGVTDGDGDALTYNWNFGGGDTAQTTTASVTHAYATLGPKAVTVAVSDGIDSTPPSPPHPVNVDNQNQPPTVTISADRPSVPAGTEAITFTATGGDVDDAASTLTYEWDVDGGTCTAPDVTVRVCSFPAVADLGSHTIEVQVRDPKGGVSLAAKSKITVTNLNPIAALTAGPTPAGLNQPVTYDASGSSPADLGQTVTAYVWDVGGATCTAPSVAVRVCTYPTEGTKTASVTVSDGYATTTISKSVRILTRKPPVVDFVVSPALTFAAGTTATVVSTTQAGEAAVTKLEWDLNGDGVYGDALGVSASQAFPTAGSYKIGLKATDAAGLSSTLEKPIVVTAVPVVTPPVNPPVIPQGPAVQPPAARPTILSALVRISGTVVGGGVRVSQLRVTASAGTKVRVVCKGKGCVLTKRALRLSVAKARRLSKKTFNSTVSGKKGFVTFTSLKRKLYIGTTIEVYVTKPGTYGKFTRFTIRKGRSPLRKDACVDPTTSRATVCPAV